MVTFGLSELPQKSTHSDTDRHTYILPFSLYLTFCPSEWCLQPWSYLLAEQREQFVLGSEGMMRWRLRAESCARTNSYWHCLHICTALCGNRVTLSVLSLSHKIKMWSQVNIPTLPYSPSSASMLSWFGTV